MPQCKGNTQDVQVGWVQIHLKKILEFYFYIYYNKHHVQNETENDSGKNNESTVGIARRDNYEKR
jgi:hypothetical protein